MALTRPMASLRPLPLHSKPRRCKPPHAFPRHGCACLQNPSSFLWFFPVALFVPVRLLKKTQAFSEKTEENAGFATSGKKIGAFNFYTFHLTAHLI
jgi:hypothetical protein